MKISSICGPVVTRHRDDKNFVDIEGTLQMPLIGLDFGDGRRAKAWRREAATAQPTSTVHPSSVGMGQTPEAHPLGDQAGRMAHARIMTFGEVCVKVDRLG